MKVQALRKKVNSYKEHTLVGNVNNERGDVLGVLAPQ